jgi:hypothetical protein
MWIENVRSDGVRVEPDGENWVIVRDGSPVVKECPCCDLPFAKPRPARLIADYLYPEQL